MNNQFKDAITNISTFSRSVTPQQYFTLNRSETSDLRLFQAKGAAWTSVWLHKKQPCEMLICAVFYLCIQIACCRGLNLPSQGRPTKVNNLCRTGNSLHIKYPGKTLTCITLRNDHFTESSARPTEILLFWQLLTISLISTGAKRIWDKKMILCFCCTFCCAHWTMVVVRGTWDRIVFHSPLHDNIFVIIIKHDVSLCF